MSRTKRGDKGPGYEYWTRRANGDGKWHNQLDKTTKRFTHKKERREAKDGINNETE